MPLNQKRESSAIDQPELPESRTGAEGSRPSKRYRGESWRPPMPRERFSSCRRPPDRWSAERHSQPHKDSRNGSPDVSRSANKSSPRKRKSKEIRPGLEERETKGLSDKIHSLRRLLEKATDLPVDVRQEKERELQCYYAEQQIRKAKRETKLLTSRYHFIRFLERKQADRRLKRLEKEFNEWKMSSDYLTLSIDTTIAEPHCEDEMEGSDDEDRAPVSSTSEEVASKVRHFNLRLHEARVDLNYTLYAPLDQKYVSLYPAGSKRKTPHTQAEAIVGREHGRKVDEEQAGLMRNESGQKPPLWHEVEKAMESGSLDALRDGKLLNVRRNECPSLAIRSVAAKIKVEEAKPGSDDERVDEDDFFQR